MRQEDIAAIYAIEHTRFYVKPFRESGGPVQCRRCLNYGHIKKYCGRRVRCPLCSEEHEEVACPKTAPIKCGNCQGAHPASSKDCPHRTKLLNMRKKHIETIPQLNASTSKQSSSVQQNRNYSRLNVGYQAPSQSRIGPALLDQDFPHLPGKPLLQQAEPKANQSVVSPETANNSSLHEDIRQLTSMMNTLLQLVMTLLQEKRHA